MVRITITFITSISAVAPMGIRVPQKLWERVVSNRRLIPEARENAYSGTRLRRLRRLWLLPTIRQPYRLPDRTLGTRTWMTHAWTVLRTRVKGKKPPIRRPGPVRTEH